MAGGEEMTESRRQESHMYCECNEKIKTSAHRHIAVRNPYVN